MDGGSKIKHFLHLAPGNSGCGVSLEPKTISLLQLVFVPCFHVFTLVMSYIVVGTS